MIVTLIGKNVLYRTKLPNVPIGNYWITDENDKKLINIEGDKGSWKIFSNKNIKIIKPKSLTSLNVSKIAQSTQNIFKEITLKEYSMRYIYLKDQSNNVFVLYCAPSYDQHFTHLNIKNSKLNMRFQL